MKLFMKLRRGVIEIAAGDDCRYAEPSFLQRAYLLWTFRNFRRLSVRVLNPRQRQIVHELSETTHIAGGKTIDSALVIGRAEFHELPVRKPLGPVIVPSPEQMVALPDATRIVNYLSRLPGVIARQATKFIAIPSIRRTQSHARYSLILTLAAASLLIISGAVAQRLWVNHGKSSSSAIASVGSPGPVTPEGARFTTATKPLAVAISTASAGAKPSPKKLAIAVKVPTQESSTIVPNNTPAVTSPSSPVKTQGTARDAEGATDGRRLRVFLAPRNVIYPTLPNSGVSTDRKRDILVKATVNINGTVDVVQVPGQTASLATAIASSVKQWRYQPYMLNGQPVEVETHMIFTVLGPDAITVRFLPASETGTVR